jgi:uncharacterized damage-inducible protein DinB
MPTPIAQRFREVILNGTWIANTNLKAQLSDLTWEQAEHKIGSFNTIALLAQHLHYYIKGILNVFEGGTLDIRDKYSFDFAPFTSQADWEQFLATFWADAERFAQCVEAMSEEQLLGDFAGKQYGTTLRNIDAMIEHSYYHLGQIVQLRKMIEGKNH